MKVQRKMVHGNILICGLLVGGSLWATGARGAESNDASKLLVVDCLLPGQVRKLGTSVTYLTARRPAKTSAGECEVRGGEYVESDRGNYASALKIWIPGARDGDKVAQTYVGEIFEKGAGAGPDYAAAASWYQKAADQGYARAQINLGFLYEKGLGVAKDPVAALNWYRKASGLSDAIALDDGNATVVSNANANANANAASQQKELEALRKELAQAQKQLDGARQELERRKQRSQSEVNRLEDQRRKAADAGNVGEVKKLETLLAQREQELSERGQDVTRLEEQMSGFRTQLASLQTESAGLREELERARQQLSGSQKELTARRSELADTKRRLDSTRADLAKQKQAATTAAQAETKRLQVQLSQREQDLKAQTDELARAEQKAQRYRDDLAGLETKAAQKTTATAAAPAPAATNTLPPSIQIIDPPIVLTRATPSIEVRGGVATRDIVGRVTAAGGLLSFSVNDHAEEKAVDANGMFRVAVALSSKSTPVSIVAVDQQGKRSAVAFTLVPDAQAATVAAPPAVKVSPLNFGAFYALVIGNESYQHLTALKTAVNDATAIADVLTTKYGFKTTLLKNATRYQILSELNRLRSQLTENDNLMIYYAGHGELDKTNLRGYWLPVDAEADSDANWISSIAITDILNAMSVKHVLVVADSCYSGALTRSSIGQLEAGRSDEERNNWLKAISKSRSRVVLTSGGLQPVLDGGGGKHSVFARSFLEVLTVNSEVIEARRVYQELSARVLNDALRYRIEQVPQYAPMQFAGHESGDFLFVRRAN